MMRITPTGITHIKKPNLTFVFFQYEIYKVHALTLLNTYIVIYFWDIYAVLR